MDRTAQLIQSYFGKVASGDVYELSTPQHPAVGYQGVAESTLDALLQKLATLGGILPNIVTLHLNGTPIGIVRRPGREEDPQNKNPWMRIIVLYDHSRHPYKWSISKGVVTVLD